MYPIQEESQFHLIHWQPCTLTHWLLSICVISMVPGFLSLFGLVWLIYRRLGWTCPSIHPSIPCPIWNLKSPVLRQHQGQCLGRAHGPSPGGHLGDLQEGRGQSAQGCSSGQLNCQERPWHIHPFVRSVHSAPPPGGSVAGGPPCPMKPLGGRDCAIGGPCRGAACRD